MKTERKNTFIKLVILELIIVALVLLTHDVKYEVSDDFIMELMLSGTYSGTVNPHLLFSNYFWGLFLSVFYKLNAAVSWYLIWQMIVGFLSYIAVARVLSRKMDFIYAAGLLAIFNIGTVFDIFVLPQFTKTAAIALIAGGMLFLDALFDRDSIPDCIFGVVLFAVGALIRFKMLYAAMPFLFLYLIVKLIERKDKECIKTIVYAVLTLSAVLCVRYLGSALGSNSEEYRYFSQWKSARAQYIDYYHPEYSEISAELNEAGITENTLGMINCWQYPDPSDPDLKKMNDLVEIVSEYRKSQTHSADEIVTAIRNRNMKRYPGAVICVLLGVICCLLNRKRSLVPVICCFILLGYFAYFAYVQRQVYRVESSCCMYAACIIAGSIRISDTRKPYVPAVIYGAVIAAVFLLWPLFTTTQYSNGSAGYEEYINAVFYDSGAYNKDKYRMVIDEENVYPGFVAEAKANPDKIYIMDFDTVIQKLYFFCDPFLSAAGQFPPNLVYMGGVLANYPEMNYYMRSLGYNSWAEALLSGKAYYVCNNRPELMLNYYHEHGYTDVVMQEEKTIDGLTMYSFHE